MAAWESVHPCLAGPVCHPRAGRGASRGRGVRTSDNERGQRRQGTGESLTQLVRRALHYALAILDSTRTVHLGKLNIANTQGRGSGDITINSPHLRHDVADSIICLVAAQVMECRLTMLSHSQVNTYGLCVGNAWFNEGSALRQA